MLSENSVLPFLPRIHELGRCELGLSGTVTLEDITHATSAYQSSTTSLIWIDGKSDITLSGRDVVEGIREMFIALMSFSLPCPMSGGGCMIGIAGDFIAYCLEGRAARRFLSAELNTQVNGDKLAES